MNEKHFKKQLNYTFKYTSSTLQRVWEYNTWVSAKRNV